MVRFSELMGADEDPEGEPPKGGPASDPRPPAGDEPHGAPPQPESAAPGGPTMTLPPDSGTPTPANGPVTNPSATVFAAADGAPGSPTEGVEKAVNDDLLPRRKRRR